LAHLQLRGPHDLRHSFSTWLEDEGIPARVIDELMATSAATVGSWRGSRIGARYRHTTPEMADRVVQALDTRLSLALHVAEATTRAEVHPSDRVF
jgi:integrase